VTTPHDILELLPTGVRAEIVEGDVIVAAATPMGKHAKVILAVRRAFLAAGIVNLYENTTLLVERDEDEYVPDLALWPEELIDGEEWEFPASQCGFALEVVSGSRPGRRRRDYAKALGYARGRVPTYLIVDPDERVCVLYTEPRDDGYAVEQTVKFGETVRIPGGARTVALPTDGL
jgi:Uma2 family endonuclease